MSVNFPTSLDALTNPLSTDYLNSPDHATQHANANDAVEALEAKVGVDSSAVTTSLDYIVSNASSSDPGHKHTTAGLTLTADELFVTAAEKTVIGNTSGSNTGDNTVCTSGTATSAGVATNIAGGAGGQIPYQSAENTTALLANGTAGQVLTSNGTSLAPFWTTVGVGDMVLADVQSVTGLKTFDTTKLAVKGSSTGSTAIASANASATDYTQTLQARTGTIANLDNVTYIGTTSVALNRGSGALTLAGITLTTPNIGTPSAGTLTSCTGLPLTGLVDDTTTALGVGTLELGHASDTTLSRSGAGVLAVEGVVVPTISSTNTFTNKRITPRTGTATSSATPTINTDNVDFYSLTAQAVNITSFTTNLSGTPTERQTLWIAITGTAARAITWGASFEASTVALPTTTVTTARLDVGFVWNTVTSKWRCIASA